MRTFSITCRTNGYQASRNIMFKGVYCGGSEATATLADGLTLAEAKEKLLAMYHSDRTDQRSNYSSWNVILRHDNDSWNHSGLFGYHEDGYYYNIVEE